VVAVCRAAAENGDAAGRTSRDLHPAVRGNDEDPDPSTPGAIVPGENAEPVRGRDFRRRLARGQAGACLLLLLLAGCGGTRPTPPTAGTDEVIVTGGERLGWDQGGSRPPGAVGYSYVAYVDGVRELLQQVRCASEPTPVGYACTASMPTLSLGRHTIELAALGVVDGHPVESPRSAPVIVRSVSAASAARAVAEQLGTPFIPPAAPKPDVTIEGRVHSVETVARNLTCPVALAFPADGRVVLAERGGTVRIIDPATEVSATALVADDLREDGKVIVQDLILHPDFGRSRFVLLLYTVASRSGVFTRVMRFREVGNTLGEPAVLLTTAPSLQSDTSAAMAFGAGRIMFVATTYGDAGDVDPTAAGRLFRLQDLGPTAGYGAPSPMWTSTASRPVAMGWNTATRRLWLVDRSRVPAAADNQVERIVRPDAAAAGYYRGTGLPVLRNLLLVASARDDRIETLRFDGTAGHWIPRPVGMTQSLGRIAVVREGPDGSLYMGSDNAVPGGDFLMRILPPDVSRHPAEAALADGVQRQQ
jgi:glucose/arabinose dehydrogenase